MLPTTDTAAAFGRVQTFFDDWRFPVVLVSMLLAFVLLMVVILLMPAGEGTAGAFAEAFRVWCFNYDPATRTLEWAYLWMYVVQPLVLALGVFLLWRRPVLEAVGNGLRGTWPYVGGSIAVVVVLAFALFSLSGWESRAADTNPFPGERIRTTLVPPPFVLTDQDRREVALADLEGRVVLVTAVYASCPLTCPLILTQARTALEALSTEERTDVTSLALTFDPAHDTPEVLRRLATAHRLHEHDFRLLTGEPAQVENVLDGFQFARLPGSERGQFDHASLFILIDRSGRIAYRFTLGPQQERWLVAGLRELILEEPVG